MQLFKTTNINFIEKRKTWYIVSSVFVLVGMISIFINGINYGIDFKGGTEVVLSFEKNISVSDIRNALNKVGLGKSEIKYFGDDKTVLVRTTEQAEGSTIKDKINHTIKTTYPDRNFVIQKDDVIGPKIGKELRISAMYAIFWAFFVILVYIAFRFKFQYGMGAVIALIHDVFATLGFISIMNSIFPSLNLEITQEVIAAFLTLVGVSVNDTVVIFDRIRENEKLYRSMSLSEVMNKSLNDTLSRTIITSATILIVLLVLLFFGGEVLRGFAFTMAFGIITGTYSSIYIASSFVLDWTLYKKQKSK